MTSENQQVVTDYIMSARDYYVGKLARTLGVTESEAVALIVATGIDLIQDTHVACKKAVSTDGQDPDPSAVQALHAAILAGLSGVLLDAYTKDTA